MQPISERLRHAAEQFSRERKSHRLLMQAAGRADQVEHALEPLLTKLHVRVGRHAPTESPGSGAEPRATARGDTAPARDSWDEVDEASWESFPASDPPAHWAGKDRV